MLGRWRRYAHMSAGTNERLRFLASISVNLATLFQQLISVALVIGGFYLFSIGSVSMGGIIAIVMLAGRAMAPVSQLAFVMTRGRQAITTMRSLQSLSEAPDERRRGARGIVPTVARADMVFDKVSFRYPGAQADSLSEVSISINAGERVGVIGRVGSGKSTLGRVLCGLYPPTDGALLLGGVDTRQFQPHQLREALHYVGQDSELFSGTIRDNLLLAAAGADEQDLVRAVQMAGADEFLFRGAQGFDLDVGERGRRLSGGQRSFIVLARALINPPKALFLDEPTGAMDVQTESLFIEHLKDALDRTQTLIVSTHRHAVLNVVDRLIVLDRGRVIADGPRDEILRTAAQRQGAAA
jgi:ATP-binding cassette subfamily C protein LapB